LLLFFKKEESSFSEEKEAKRLLFLVVRLGAHASPIQAPSMWTKVLSRGPFHRSFRG
jgi:hypothetical protein